MPRILHVPPFELHPAARTLLRDGRPLPVGGRAFDVLLALVEARGELVTKDQLLQRAWPGLVVEEANIHVQVSQLRKWLGADAIATVQGIGYRFSRPVSDGAVPTAVRHNLPAERTAFVGREAVLDDARRRLAATRLLTLVGLGGTGKTRLARRLAAQQLEGHPDGVWWVDLAPVDDGARVAAAVAQVLGCPVADDGSPAQAVAAHLRERRALLVLDNCEHLLDAVAREVDALLAAAPGVTVLATSRDALTVDGEAVLPVRPMAVPSPGDETVDGCESVRLFVQAALQAHPDFALDAATAADVGAICRELDGLPLAIELAAAQLRLVTARQLLGALRERFRVLGGPRRALPRQRTLRAVIQWSWEHLRGDERGLLAALAVCAGGADLDTVIALAGPAVDCGAALAALGRLADLSLVTVVHAGPVARYRLLETVAQFALDKLADDGGLGALRDRHLDHFAARAARWYADWDGAGRADALADADANHENAMRGLDWAVTGRRWREAAALADHLSVGWTARHGAAVGLDVIDTVLALVPDGTGDATVADLCCNAATLALRRGQPGRARAYALRGVDTAHRADDRAGVLEARIMVARCDQREHHLDAARATLAPVLDEARAAGLDIPLGNALNVLGQVQMDQDDLDGARATFVESAALSRRLGRGYDTVVDGFNVATVALEAGDAAEARRWMRSVGSLRGSVEHRYVDQMWLDLAAWLAAAEGDWPRAVRGLVLTDRLAAQLHHARSRHWTGLRERLLGEARAAIGDAAVAAAQDEGMAAPLASAGAEVDDWIGHDGDASPHRPDGGPAEGAVSARPPATPG